ncbi:MAG: hypothetical protein NZ802_10980, partial [Candidatus Poseidoniales archaeon]|nr:hypothetical protein [Candidatus Poseidoniales archaeon]
MGGDEPDYSGFEGCTEEDVQCEAELPQENETQEEVEPPPTDLVFTSLDGVELRAALYLPESEGPHPVIMWIHGGGWQQGNRLVAGNHATQQIVGFGNWA